MAGKSFSANTNARLEQDGTFIIENYHQAKPFSNFFPGIAGIWGIPLWVFYVNRGQGISSFGIESKDKAMLEFLPANKAYRLTTLQGFRTFLKFKISGKTYFYEPFRGNFSSTMAIRSHDLTISETHPQLGVTVKINYATLPSADFAALIRRVELQNGSGKKIDFELVDGLPIYLPFGMKDWVLKNMSRTVEAWVKVDHILNRAPFYHLNVEVADSPDVTYIHEGNFFVSFAQGDKNTNLLPVIVDSSLIFGQATDFLSPEKFWTDKPLQLPRVQETASRTPSAMSWAWGSLKPRQSKSWISVFGHTYSVEHLKSVVKQITKPLYIEQKLKENEDLISGIKSYAFTHSSTGIFDQYCGQTFLDNVMRGGLPITVQTAEGKGPLNVYSRKHGDPERDYNYFVLSPSYFSQGNGNFRDVNQNRRLDVLFNINVRESTVIDFFNLIQADGYNPLVIRGTTFSFSDPEHLEIVLQDLVDGKCESLRNLLQKSFQPGEVFKCIMENNLKIRGTQEEFLNNLLKHCRRNIIADHGEGFWSDHWTYNLDLLESFSSVYPDKIKSLLTECKAFCFYHNSHYLATRKERYVLTPKGVRQMHAVIDASKEIRAHERGSQLRVEQGEGEVYHTTLLAKLICLAANKAAGFDPSGIGLEMEADKPNWYDALNGLPGLLGSSISETLELQRLCLWILNSFEQHGLKSGEVEIFQELSEFINEMNKFMNNDHDPQALWHKMNDAKEHYRQKIRKGISGIEINVPIAEIRAFLNRVVDRCRKAVELGRNTQGLITTYFYHEIMDYAGLSDGKTTAHVLPVSFKRHDLPLFLEGFVHFLRVHRDQKTALDMHHKVLKSDLYDRKLKMFKVNANLSHQTEEIGRTRIFPSGWLENESVWLHMEYKYLLELLKSGLTEEFYKCFKTCLVPFLDPKVYGRSPLENSSFIASSRYSDKNMHGQGFVARLSGSTAEFLHIWLLMNAGMKLFQWDAQQGLSLKFEPKLPGWLFSKTAQTIFLMDSQEEFKKYQLPKNTYAFHFLGNTLIVYHNPKRKDTFGNSCVKIKKMTVHYAQTHHAVDIDGDLISAALAQDVREQKMERIDVYLA